MHTIKDHYVVDWFARSRSDFRQWKPDLCNIVVQQRRVNYGPSVCRQWRRFHHFSKRAPYPNSPVRTVRIG